MDLTQKNKLLYSRAAFGISVEKFHKPLPVTEAVDQLFPTGEIEKIEVISEQEWQQHMPRAMKGLKEKEDAGSVKDMQRAFREKTKNINLAWIDVMTKTPYPLVEKTALFWHGHFAARIGNPYYDQELLHIIRRNALGSFRTMLKEVSQSSAMLQFLNNQQNKKAHPNENFAREVMELFTMGRGHYTENDIKEAARAFTGWAYDDEGRFIYRFRQHDDGEKTFLGKSDNFNGDDILDIILQQKQTAVFITQKLYRYFVSDEKIDEQRVAELSTVFYNSNYNIGALLKTIFTASWFYSPGIAGSKVKAPVELLVAYQRTVPFTFYEAKTPINLQRVLGQFLFNPPNVAGWPGGRSWIDSSSLMIRMRLPEALYGSKELNLGAKDADMDDMKTMQHAEGINHAGTFRIARASVTWDSYIDTWKAIPRDQLPAMLAAFLLPATITAGQLKEMIGFADKDSPEDYIKSLTILFMGMPQYQLT